MPPKGLGQVMGPLLGVLRVHDLGTLGVVLVHPVRLTYVGVVGRISPLSSKND